MLPSTRKDLQSLIDSLLREESFDGLDDRRCPRYRLHLNVECFPVTVDGESIGESFRAMTENVSETGVQLLVDSNVEAGYLRIVFPTIADRATEFTMSILRCTEYGPFYHVAGEFLWYESVAELETATT